MLSLNFTLLDLFNFCTRVGLQISTVQNLYGLRISYDGEKSKPRRGDLTVEKSRGIDLNPEGVT